MERAEFITSKGKAECYFFVGITSKRVNLSYIKINQLIKLWGINALLV